MLSAATSAPPGLPARQSAADFLKAALANGPRTSRELWPLAQQERFSKRTLNRAKEDLHIRSVRLWANGQRLSYWLLPTQCCRPMCPPTPSRPTWSPGSPRCASSSPHLPRSTTCSAPKPCQAHEAQPVGFTPTGAPPPGPQPRIPSAARPPSRSCATSAWSPTPGRPRSAKAGAARRFLDALPGWTLRLRRLAEVSPFAAGWTQLAAGPVEMAETPEEALRRLHARLTAAASGPP